MNTFEISKNTTQAVRSIPRILTLLVALALCLNPAQASWLAIDDFESYNTGVVRANGANVTNDAWIAHGNANEPQISQDGAGGNKYLGFNTVSAFRGASHLMHEDFQLGVGGGTATYFMRVRIAANHDVLHFGFATPNRNTTTVLTTQNDFLPNAWVLSDGEVGVVDGDSFRGNLASMPENTWTNFWMVVNRGTVDTPTNTWSLYTSTGNNSPTLLGADIAFRANTSSSLGSVMVMAKGGAGETALFDDIYFSSGENLSVIPEPSTFLMMGMALGLLVLNRFTRKRR